MSESKSKIVNILNMFKNIYRLTLENGMIIDIYENKSPCINSIFSYKIFNNYENKNFVGTVMNGYIYKTTKNETYASFGGLLCKIPKIIEYENKHITINYDLI